MTTASTARIPGFRENRFVQRLTAVFVVVWIASAVHPEMVGDWWLENILVVLLVGALVTTYRRLPLSDLSYSLLFVFLVLHEWGAHHKYATVPLGEWIKVWLETSRNHYDRIVHFAFGVLFAYPIREVLLRKSGACAYWLLLLPVVASLALGAAYEIIEAVVASIVSPEAGDAFLGLQGDEFDTQKDMGLAMAGATATMAALTVAKHFRRDQRPLSSLPSGLQVGH
jgi:putative membrane protein